MTHPSLFLALRQPLAISGCLNGLADAFHWFSSTNQPGVSLVISSGQDRLPVAAVQDERSLCAAIAQGTMDVLRWMLHRMPRAIPPLIGTRSWRFKTGTLMMPL